MKKILVALTMIATAGLAFGQGQVNFINTTTTLITANGSNTTSVVPSYYYGIFWAPQGVTTASEFTLFGYGTNTTTAGRFSGGAGTASAPAISGKLAGSSVNILVRGWSANLGRDWNIVLASVNSIQNGVASVGPSEGFYYGQSGLATDIILGGGGTAQPVPTAFGNAANQINTGFVLNYTPVPEPSTFALAGLAGAAMLIFRRRK